MLSFSYSPEFQRDLKSYTKRWRSLPKDLQSAQAALIVVFGGDEKIYQQFIAQKTAALLTESDSVRIYKMRLDCKSLGNDKKTRLVFIFEIIEDNIVFVELYAKNDKDREDSKRYEKYL